MKPGKVSSQSRNSPWIRYGLPVLGALSIGTVAYLAKAPLWLTALGTMGGLTPLTFGLKSRSTGTDQNPWSLPLRDSQTSKIFRQEVMRRINVPIRDHPINPAVQLVTYDDCHYTLENLLKIAFKAHNEGDFPTVSRISYALDKQLRISELSTANKHAWQQSPTSRAPSLPSSEKQARRILPVGSFHLEDAGLIPVGNQLSILNKVAGNCLNLAHSITTYVASGYADQLPSHDQSLVKGLVVMNSPESQSLFFNLGDLLTANPDWADSQITVSMNRAGFLHGLCPTGTNYFVNEGKHLMISINQPSEGSLSRQTISALDTDLHHQIQQYRAARYVLTTILTLLQNARKAS